MAAPLRTPYSYEETDSDALPPGQRLALWRDTGRLPMEPGPADGHDQKQFRICLKRLVGPCGRFADLTATPMTLNRTTGHCHQDGVDMVSLTLMLDCDVAHQFSAGGQPVTVRTGAILLKDFTRPAAAWWSRSVHRGLNLHLPRVSVGGAVGKSIDQLHGVVLSGDGLAPLLKAQLSVLADTAPGLNMTARAAALDATVALATTVLRVEFGTQLEDEQNSPGIFAAARVFIDGHLASRRLTPELIAKHLGCSRSHLYRVFSTHDATVAEYIRDARLRRARELIADGKNGDARIGDIAFRCGFDDPVHFARLFRQRFGITPREVKATGGGTIL